MQMQVDISSTEDTGSFTSLEGKNNDVGGKSQYVVLTKVAALSY